MIFPGALSAPLLLALILLAPADYLADGVKALESDQPAEAESLLRKAVGANAGNYAAHFNLALALSLQRKDSEAVVELRKTLGLKPGLYEADVNLGILLVRDKLYSEALPLLKEASEARPNDVRTRLYYAQALLETGSLEDAERQYSAAALADPKSKAAQSGLAQTLLRESKLSDSAEHFRAAGDQNGLLQVAAAYEKANQKDKAIAIYKELPDNPAVRERLGQLLIDTQDPVAAIPNLEEAVRRNPGMANRLALADAYRMSKQPAKMLEQLQLAATADPNNFDLRMALGRALRDQRKMIPAAEQFLAATKLQPASAPAWNELATALIVNENYAEGLAVLDRIRALGKEIPGDLYLRAITLDKLKQRPQAIAAYQQFLSASNGAFPDQEFLARQRVRIIESELKKK